MALISKITLKNASGTDVEYDIGASATNIAYDNNNSIKDIADNLITTVEDQTTAINGKVSSSGGSLAATVAGDITSQASSSDIVTADTAAVIWGKFNALRDEFGNHEDSPVFSENGIHGIRYYQDELQVWDESTEEWISITLPSGGGDMLKSVYDPDDDGIIGTAQGGTGNADGYIRTGQESGSTVGSSATIEGLHNTAQGATAHAEGNYTDATGNYAHSEGWGTSALGVSSHTEGRMTKTGEDATGAHAEGYANQSSTGGIYASAVGAHAEGATESSVHKVQATGKGAHAEGYLPTNASKGITASGNGAHAEGSQTVASGAYSHAEGQVTTASGEYGSHSEGYATSASGASAHAEGGSTIASGASSHAEGDQTSALSDMSHAEGFKTKVDTNAWAAHAEGYSQGDDKILASAYGAHAEGNTESTSYGIIASGKGAHAEGYISSNASKGSVASGNGSHVEGSYNTASGNASHAEGSNNIASGDVAHVEGLSNVAAYAMQHVMGYYNDNKQDTYFEIGNGTSASNRKNSFEIYVDGSISQDNGATKHKVGVLQINPTNTAFKNTPGAIWIET